MTKRRSLDSIVSLDDHARFLYFWFLIFDFGQLEAWHVFYINKSYGYEMDYSKNWWNSREQGSRSWWTFISEWSARDTQNNPRKSITCWKVCEGSSRRWEVCWWWVWLLRSLLDMYVSLAHMQYLIVKTVKCSFVPFIYIRIIWLLSRPEDDWNS